MARSVPRRVGSARRPTTPHLYAGYVKDVRNLQRHVVPGDAAPPPCLPTWLRTTPPLITSNDDIRTSHRAKNINIVGYHTTAAEKEEIKDLIRAQTTHYRRDQDKRAQMTKQTRELDRLPVWPPNSPDLNLIEVVWSWMVRWMRDHDDGWPNEPQVLKQRVLEAWDAVPLESFRELVRSYRFRLQTIHSVEGDRHPQFA